MPKFIPKLGNYEKILLLILIISLAAKIQIPEKRALWWDESVYLGLAENIYFEHSYHFNIGDQEQFRPPLLPLLLALAYPMFGSFESAGIFLNILISLVSILVMYYIVGKVYNKRYGILAAFIMATSTEYIFWSSKILTETLSLLLIIVSLYLFYMAFEKNRKEFYPYLGLITALAFLLRYPNGLLIPFFIIYALYRRNLKKLINRKALLGLITFLMLLTPWVAMNYKNYENPLGGASYNFNLINNMTPWHMPLFYLTEFVTHFQTLTIVMIIGLLIVIKRREKKDIFFAMWTFITLLFFSLLVGQKHFRYIIIALPSITIMSVYGLDYLTKIFRNKKYEKIIIFLFVILMLMPAYGAYYISYENLNSRMSLRDAAEYIKSIAPENCYIMGQPYPMLHYYTKHKVVGYPKNQEDIPKFMKKYNISFVVYENSETYPAYAETWLENNESLVKIFEKRENEYFVKVYKYALPEKNQ